MLSSEPQKQKRKTESTEIIYVWHRKLEWFETENEKRFTTTYNPESKILEPNKNKSEKLH